MGRMNPAAYKAQFRFKSSCYPIYKLRDLAWIDPSVSFKSLKNIDMISFIPIECIDEKNGIIMSPRYIECGSSKGYTRFAENDILWAKITPHMQNAKSAIAHDLLNGLGCGSTDYYVIRPKSEKVLSEYLLFLLRDHRILDSAQNFLGGTVGQQRVSSDFLQNFDVPLPPKPVQKVIIKILSDASEAKIGKENQGQALLSSIDEYLLNELRIHLPERDSTLPKRIFTTSFSKISDKRLDPLYQRLDLENICAGSKVCLRDVCISFKSGFGARKQNQIETGGYLHIRPTNINKFGELCFDKNIFVPFTPNASKLEKNDVLFNNTNSQELVGKTALHINPIEAYFSSHITCIKINQDYLSAAYLWCILNLYQHMKVFYVLCANWNNQSSVGIDVLKKLIIPFPSLDTQNKVANHILTIHAKAKALGIEASKVLTDARLQVEKMILGK